MKIANRWAGDVLPFGRQPSTSVVDAINRESALLESRMAFRRDTAADVEVHSVCACVCVCVRV